MGGFFLLGPSFLYYCVKPPALGNICADYYTYTHIMYIYMCIYILLRVRGVMQSNQAMHSEEEIRLRRHTGFFHFAGRDLWISHHCTHKASYPA